MAFAFGEMGMPQSEFWEMTPREFWNASRGYTDKEQQRYQTSWEQTRWLGTLIANHLGTKKGARELQPFPWDKPVDRSEEIELIKERRKWRAGH